MSRGNSLVAGVVLIGMLTTLAVALQSANPQVESEAQVAGAKVAMEDYGTAKSKAVETGSQDTPCVPGFTYKVLKDGTKTKTQCQRDLSCFNDAPKTKTKGTGTTKDTSEECQPMKSGAGKQKAKSKADEENLCVNDNSCDVLYCVKTKDGESCVKAAKKNEGESIVPENIKKDVAKSLAEAAKSDSLTPDQLEGYKNLAKSDADLNKIFKDAEVEKQKELDAQKAAAEADAKNTKTAEDRLAQCALYSEGCPSEQKAYDEAKAKSDASAKKQKELENQVAALKAAQVALDPAKDSKAGKEKVDTSGNPTCKGANCKADPGPGTQNPGGQNPGGQNPGGQNPGGGQQPSGGQPTFPQPQQQQQQNQCSWIQSLFSSCPQLECKIQVMNQPQQQQQPGQPQQPVTLQWQTTGGNAQFATISGLGTVPPNGQAQVNPQVTTMYSMQVQGQATQQGQSGQNAQCQTTVTVGGQNPTQPGGPTLTLSAVPSSIAQGETSKLRWSGTNVTTCTASEGWIGTKAASGEESVSPLKTTTYGLACQGNTGSASRQVTVTVGAAASSTPGAEISCEPKIADVGMKIAISYSCKNSVKGVGIGFSTNDQTSGSAEATIEKPPAGTDTVSYGLTCTTNDGKEVNASPVCKVQINKPSLILVANPKKIDTKDSKSDTTTLGWVTKGMKSCVISSPDDDAFTEKNKNKKNTSGSLKTGVLTKDTEFVLTCVTLADQEKETTVEVDVI